MEAEAPTPNIGLNLLRVHRAVTRALDIAVDAGQTLAGEGTRERLEGRMGEHETLSPRLRARRKAGSEAIVKEAAV